MTQGIQNQTAKETDRYWEKFEGMNWEPKHPSWVFPIRKAAISRFAELGFPTTHDEDWRFTNVAPIAKLPFKPVFEYSRGNLDAAAIKQYSFADLKGSRLVFVNGHFSKEFSAILPQPDGIKINSLDAAFKTDSAIIEKHLGRHAPGNDNPFTALNTAFFHDGAFIYVPAGKTVAEPVHLLFISTSKEAGTTTHPRNLIIAEKGSKLTVIESYVGTAGGQYFTNAVEELVIGENAVVEHCKFQDESPAAFHIAAIHVHLSRNCNFIAHSIATGARLSRNNIRTSLADEGVECILNGLYVTKDDQLADHHMIVDHAKPHCNSHEYYNGILDGKSKGVFHGRILVRPDAQKTDAKQTNKNLLLSEDATIDTKPQLEIYADDVKCTHGATVGQLNDESIFYLRARGIGLETARRMLIHAFAGEIIDRIRYAPVREEMDKIVWDRLEQNPLVAEKK
ncbi:MAG TPA: Fe-S cluster assembly protein SufD [Verrucomicrobiae bacterium]|nr:Fe-S cluster assembly protein SufD [Verrucomicrobiae bacterium]